MYILQQLFWDTSLQGYGFLESIQTSLYVV